MSKNIRRKISHLTLGVIVVNTMCQSVTMAQEIVHNQSVEVDQSYISQIVTTTPAISEDGIVTTSPAISLDGVVKTTDGAIDIVKPLEDGHYTIDLKVWQENSDVDSMCSSFIGKEDAQLEVVDGKTVLTTYILKNPKLGGVVSEDAINEVEYKDEDGTWVEVEKVLKTKVINGKEEEVWEIQFPVENQGATLVTRAGIKPMFGMKPAFRMILQEDTLEKVEAPSTPLELVDVHVTHETGYGRKDGTLQITATGGSGKYVYSIDNGESYKSENRFNQLAPKTYQVVIKDLEKETLVKRDIVINADEKMDEGYYAVELDLGTHEAEFKQVFNIDNKALSVEKGKIYLELMLKEHITEVYYMATEFTPLEIHTQNNTRSVKIPFESIESKVILGYKQTKTNEIKQIEIALDKESIVEQVKPVEIVDIKINNPSFKGAKDGEISVQATGGESTLEYSVNGGLNWSSNYQFTSLSEGRYEVVVRDKMNPSNQSQPTEVMLQVKEIGNGSIQDGRYGVDIAVLKENSDEPSMAAQFFQKEDLPVQVIDGKFYLTLSIEKDGMGFKNVIEGLEKKVGESYIPLELKYKDDPTKGNLTAEIELENFQDEVYIRCAIKPMAPMKPILRIKMKEGTLVKNAGSIVDKEVKVDETAITAIQVANGKIDITLNREDTTVTKEDFKAVIKIDKEDKKNLELKNFKQEGVKVSFTYDAIKTTEKVQEVMMDITFRDKAFETQTFKVGTIGELKFKLKEDAVKVSYIKGDEDGRFKPNQNITRQEALTMISRLIEVNDQKKQVVDLQVLHETKNEDSMSAQFFIKEGLEVIANEAGYLIELHIANEGLGFKDIISSIEHEKDGKYQMLEVVKSEDNKSAKVSIQIPNLKDTIKLRAGIAPMGDAKPSLRIKINEGSLRVVESTVDEVKHKLFKQLGIVSEEAHINNQKLTRSKFLEILVKIAQIELPTTLEHSYTDIDLENENLPYIIAATKQGYIEGYKDGSFKPNKEVTRAEAVTMINRMIKDEEAINVDKSPFIDVKISHWAFENIIRATK